MPKFLDRDSRKSFLASLRHRLILLSAIIFLIPAAFAVYLCVDHYLERVAEIRRSMAQQAAAVADNGNLLLLQAEKLARDSDGDQINLAAAAVDWLQLREGSLRPPTEISTNLVDGDGHAIFPADETTHFPSSDAIKTAIAQHQDVLDEIDKDGVARLYGISQIGSHGLYVLIGGNRARLLAEPWRALKVEGLALLFVLVAALAVALFVSQMLILKWSERLSQSTRMLRTGGSASVADLNDGPIEFREVNETLQAMTVRLAAGKTEMEESLRQRKLMFRELQHRVKNNLQIVISLLNLYVRLPRNVPVRSEIADLQVRLGVLALAQRQLYADEYREHIEVAPLLEGICNLLRAKTGVPVSRVPFVIAIAEAKITAEKAIPLALFVTEVLTNSLEHAYPEPRAGTISIEMKTDEQGLAMLTISDQGIGMLESPADNSAGGMGRSLIAAFAKQLDGQLAMTSKAGTTTTLSFLLDRKDASLSAPSG